MAIIGDVEFVVIDEDRQYDSEVTSHPVETGSDISDHIRLLPRVFNVNGEVTGPDAAEKHLKLAKLQASKQLTRYSGRGSMVNCVIESYNTVVNENIANGFAFSMTVREIKLANPSTIGLLPVTLRADTSEIGNAGRVQVQ